MNATDKLRKIRFRYEMIAAYHDRLAEEYQTLKGLDADVADVMQKHTESHQRQAAEAREHVAAFNAALGNSA